MASPKIEPVKIKEYTCKQSKYGDLVPKLTTRATILAPSFSGKTVLISNLILDVYRIVLIEYTFLAPQEILMIIGYP